MVNFKSGFYYIRHDSISYNYDIDIVRYYDGNEKFEYDFSDDKFFKVLAKVPSYKEFQSLIKKKNHHKGRSDILKIKNNILKVNNRILKEDIKKIQKQLHKYQVENINQKTELVTKSQKILELEKENEELKLLHNNFN